MRFNILEISEDDLPFEMGGPTQTALITITSKLDKDAIADGETEPFEWMDLRYVEHSFERLIAADEEVLNAPDARIVIDYPLETAAVREIHPNNGEAFTRGELIKRIFETYKRVYEIEESSQSTSLPNPSERELVLNRPSSDGTFGIGGHDLDDLGVSAIEVHEVEGKIWLTLLMES